MSIHVIYSAKEWKVKKQGVSKAMRVFPSRDSAVKYGKSIQAKEKASLYVHKEDGTIDKRASSPIVAIVDSI